MIRKRGSNQYQRHSGDNSTQKRSKSYFRRNSNGDPNPNQRARIKTKNNPNQRARIKTKNNPNQRVGMRDGFNHRRNPNSNSRHRNSRRGFNSNHDVYSQPSKSRGFNFNSIIIIILVLAFIIGVGIGVSQLFDLNHSETNNTDNNTTQITYQNVTNNISLYENNDGIYYDNSSDYGMDYNDSKLNVYNKSYFGNSSQVD